MIFNYLKLSVRLLLRAPFFTVINVLGLSMGFAVFIILWQYAQDELHSDNQYKDYERIYRVASQIEFEVDKKVFILDNGFDIPNHVIKLSENIPQIESFTRIFNQDNFNSIWLADHTSQLFFSIPDSGGDERKFVEQHVAYADENMFDFFGIPLVRGNALTALQLPNAVVISQHVARKYFGDRDPVNQIILLNNDIPLKVTGVFADLTKNTHMEFELVVSMHRLDNIINDFRIAPKGSPISYVKLKAGTDVGTLTDVLKADSREITEATNRKLGNGITASRTSLQPLSDVAFSNLEGDHFAPKSRTFLIILNTIAVIVLFVAWINYINLTLSASIKRMRELTTRRAIGAKPIDLIKQFVFESAVVNVISLFVALTMVQLSKDLLRFFFQFYVQDLTSTQPKTWLILGLALVLGIFFTGLYPALVMIKTGRHTSSKGVGFNGVQIKTAKGLMILQYTCALVLIIGAFGIQRQLGFILSKDIGIERDGIVIVDLPINKDQQFDNAVVVFKNQLTELPFVENLTISNNVVGDREEHGVYVMKHDEKVGFVPDCNGGVDENFLPTYQIPVLAGRNFLKDHPADTSAVMISRQGASNLYYDHPEDIVGQTLLLQEEDFSKHFLRATVIGVFEDYKRSTFFSEQESVRKGDNIGIILTYGDYMIPAQDPRKLSLKINTSNVDLAMSVIKGKYDVLFPESAFNWNILDDNINKYYIHEQIARNQIILFSGLVVAVACLGLTGMLMQRLVAKTKEIGIRKIMGAGLSHIGHILIQSSIRQMIISLAIAIPISWFLLNQYLQRFTERLYPQWWHYALPVLLLLTIVIAIVLTLIFKASKTNPVDALRHE